ncbi:MAG: hypothetical protein JWO80_1158 [Bryobacterales bacterium]|nr:hypothetical protein [Bryobacterales bacterium]
MNRTLGFVTGLALLGPLAGAAPHATLPQLLSLLQKDWKEPQAMDFMRQVYATDRFFTFPKFAETSLYLQACMRQIGLQDVEIVNAPADGKTQVGFWTEPLAWDAKSATLQLLDSSVPEDERVLADYSKVPASLGMWSGATAREGVVAEIVAVTPENMTKLDLRGKLALTDVNPAGLKWMLVQAGALGAINTFTENPGLVNGRQWINSWGDDGWAYTGRSTPLLSFSISPHQAQIVRRLLRKGPVRARAAVDTRHYAGSYPYVTGSIPGATQQEVLTLGHTSEQGAQDNATGVAATLEAMATLQRLIASGKLPRPRRGIRILSMGEMYGSMHYVQHNPEKIRRTVAAMCVDSPASSYDLAGTEYSFYMNPHVAKDFTDALILSIAALHLTSVKRPWHEKQFTTGTDTYLAEPMVGVPTVWGYSGSGVETHHNSEDTPDRVDPRSLRDISVINAAYLYFIANADASDASYLAQLSEDRGYIQIAKHAGRLLEQISQAQGAKQVAALIQDAAGQMDYAADREMQAVRSVLRLIAGPEREPVLKLTTQGAERLKAFGQQQQVRIRQAAENRAQTLGEALVPTPVQPADPQANTIVVKRIRFGTLPLDDLPHEQWEGFPSGAWSLAPTIALYWCDGHRTLAEVIRLTQFELGPTAFDFVNYFRFLQRHGYVSFLS